MDIRVAITAFLAHLIENQVFVTDLTILAIVTGPKGEAGLGVIVIAERFGIRPRGGVVASAARFLKFTMGTTFLL